MSDSVGKRSSTECYKKYLGSSSNSKRSSVEVKIENEISTDALKRDAWGGKLEFILACIGSGIGLGNVWRFPYLLFRSGGGAFLIPFVGMLILIGVPIFMMEISLGQFCSLSPLNLFKISPILKGVGYSMIFTNLMVALYYCVIISWCLYYFFCSFTSQLPWENCGNYWNTILCTSSEEFRNITKMNLSHVIRDGVNISKTNLKTPSEEFFYQKVLQMSDGIENTGTIVWELALCLLLAWLIVFVVLLKGVASLGKVVYFTSTFPYLLLTIMLIKGVLLEGSSIGIQFYILPDWNKLADPKVWSDAATQIFYSLSTCTGALIAMSSYNKFHNNTLRDSFIVPLTNVLTSIYAGFVIFSVLGYMAKMKGVAVSEVAADGPGLVFVVYPEALSLMPVAPLWSVLFFLMMIVLGFSSLFTMTETFFTAFTDEFATLLRASRIKTYLFRSIGIATFYLLSLPMVTNGGFYLFSLIDLYTGGFPLLVLAILELFLISFIYGNKRFAEDVVMMVGKHKILLLMFRISWAVISPIVILLSIIATGLSYKPPTLFDETYIYPYWSEIIGWLVVAFTMCFIPIYIICYLSKDLFKLIKEGLKPEQDWGPFANENRTGRYEPIRKLSTNPKPIEDQIYNLKSETWTTKFGFVPDGFIDNKQNDLSIDSEGMDNIGYNTSNNSREKVQYF